MLKLLKKIFPFTSTSGGSADIDAANLPSSECQHNLKIGNALLADGRLEEAAACYRQALAAAPRNTDAFVNLGYALVQLKQPVEAESVLRQALEFNSESVDALYMLATLLQAQSRHEAAIESLEKVLALNPDFEAAYVELCAALDHCGRERESLSVIGEGIERFPNIARFHYILGTLHSKKKSHTAAVIAFQKAISLQPDYANLHFNLSVDLYALGRLEEVVEHLQKAITLKSDYIDAYSNLGTALLDLNRLGEAIAAFHSAIEFQPDHAESHFNQSLCLLRLGNFEPGFKEYEWRWKDKRFQKALRNFVQPLWLGKESLENKTILLHAEQGLGDTIQFCRYGELLATRGATVILQVPEVLHGLLADLEGVSKLLKMDDQLPPFDYHCPLLSLPFAFGTSVATVPSRIPYLRALSTLDTEIQEKLTTENGFKIGICWKGNASYPRDADRSPGVAPFKNLIARFRGTGTKFYTLLPESRELMIQIGGEDLGRELDKNTSPFVETAALITNLDLVITCDTSIGHIAGALGVPTWIVLPYSPDWRWIGTNENSPWYPHTRLFHQAAPGDWEGSFKRVIDRLRKVLTDSTDPI